MNKIVAFCGYPKTGKDHAAHILIRRGFTHYDDKRVLRDMTKAAFLLDEWHVTTQAGKASLIDVGDRCVMVRRAMADLGAHFEDLYGRNFFAERALKELSLRRGAFVITSARLDQPVAYREAGALVVELVRDGCGPVVEHDAYDRSAAHVSIRNPGTPKAFEKAIIEAIETHFGLCSNAEEYEGV